MLYIVIPDTDIQLFIGSVVIFDAYPQIRWILHHGWYTYENTEFYGWYFRSIPTAIILPISEVDLHAMTIVDNSSEPMPPDPGDPEAQFTESMRDMLYAAFITVADLDALHAIDTSILPDGKLVRVNNVDGAITYYVWNIDAYEWEVVDYVTPEEFAALELRVDGKQDKLTAGDNIQISEENVISATDTTYENLPAAEGGSAVSLVSTGEKYTWNNKSEFSGSYNDLTDKPDINDATLDIQANGTSLGTFSANASSDVTINITAQDLGITSPMDFVGVSTTDPQVDGATVAGHTTWLVGEVVIYQRTGESGYEEYVNIDGNNTGASWELLGDAGSYALNSIEILAGTGLTGGGDLTQNRTLALADNYGDTKNPYASKSANLVLASPNGESGTPAFRALTATDIPTLASNNIDDTQSTTHKFVNQKMWNYLDDITFVRPAVSTFTLYNNGSAVATTVERGTVVAVNQIRHNETEIDNISSLKFKTGSTDIQDVTPVSSATTIELNSPISISATATYTLSGVNTRNETFSKSATVSVYDYAYTTVNSSAVTPTTGLTKQSITSTFASSGASITYSANDYIYIYVLSSGKKMYQNIMGQWVEVPATALGAVVITRANGTTGTYYAYRLGPMLSGGTDTFRVS